MKAVLESSGVACSGAPLPVDLVLYYRGGFDSALDRTLAFSLARVAGRNCYGSMRVEYAGVPEDTARSAGACAQFVGMLTTLPAPFWGYSAVFMMSLDVLPLRSGWLSEIMPVMKEAALGRRWVVGGQSDPSCMAAPGGLTLYEDSASKPHNGTGQHPSRRPEPLDGHIDSNAVYSANQLFVNWVLDRWVVGAPGEVPGRCYKADDYARSMFLEATKQGKKKWKADGHFMNCKPHQKLASQGVRTIDLTNIRASYTEAAVVITDRK